MTAQIARLAFDIETISPNVPDGQRPNFEDSSQFELLAATIAHQEYPADEIEAEVRFREERSPAAELDLIEWVLTRLTAFETTTVLTYNGDSFDFPQLLGRARLAAANLGARTAVSEWADEVLTSLESDDLINDAWEAFGAYTTLEEACRHAGVAMSNTYWSAYDLDLNPANWRRSGDQGTPVVLSADIAHLGEHYLDGSTPDSPDDEWIRDLEAIMRDYALADVEPLFALADRRPFTQTHEK